MTSERGGRFTLRYALGTIADFAAIERRHHGLIRRTLEERLSLEPESETRNRKRLARPTRLGATWELRFGPNNRFRALYSVDVEAYEVSILAIGIKRGNRLLAGGREVEL